MSERSVDDLLHQRVLCLKRINEVQADIDATVAEVQKIQSESRQIQDELKKHAPTLAIAGFTGPRPAADPTSSIHLSEEGASAAIMRAKALCDMDLTRVKDAVTLQSYVTEARALAETVNHLKTFGLDQEGTPSNETSAMERELAELKAEYAALMEDLSHTKGVS